MKLGILGTGMIVKDVLTMYHELGVEKTYLFSTKKSKSQALELMKKYHLDKVYTDYDELLQSDVDTIYCALPNHLHYSFSKKALENGKNVIIEKPITANSKELEDLIEIASKNHLMIFEAMNLHYTPAFLSLKEDLNKLGDIKIVSFNYSQYSSRYNAFKEGIIQPAFDYTKSGGALMDLNIYNIHLMVALFGKPLKVNYMANIEKNIDTSGIITLDYGNFKAVLIGAKDCKAPIATSIQGDQGCISIQTPANVLRSFKILHNDQREEEFDLQGDTHRMVYEFNEFVKMIENKDSDRANEMMEKSLIAMDIATKARIDAGVHFKADESYE